MTIISLLPGTLVPATAPTLYFIGVTTASSSIQAVFPRWAEQLGLTGALLKGIDLPLHADAEDYRRVVDFIARDQLSLGALVTTHKIDLFNACKDMVDILDPFALLMGETSCISKRDGLLICHAKDPISSGLALDSFVPADYWMGQGEEALCMGAGGSTIAISWYLSRAAAGENRPRRIIVTNRSAARLDHIREIHASLDTTTEFDYELVPSAADNDVVLAGLSPGALVVNATGLGKDAPGSPLTDRAVFPERSIAWDLNYRGDLVFLDQARRQQAERALQIEDGWVYFLHGWMQVIAEVFDTVIPTSGPAFDVLGELARTGR
ncbi:shikimate dehydrogenase [Microbacterium sp.]|uniref:shikimate dehydrogenase family protein n=1 Tax=Microbacterium sp. TaxID=51671 RepID=UPI0025D4F84A|nr:shikimate dehydrogenase [Microbacterium sp.]